MAGCLADLELVEVHSVTSNHVSEPGIKDAFKLRCSCHLRTCLALSLYRIRI